MASRGGTRPAGPLASALRPPRSWRFTSSWSGPEIRGRRAPSETGAETFPGPLNRLATRVFLSVGGSDRLADVSRPFSHPELLLAPAAGEQGSVGGYLPPFPGEVTSQPCTSTPRGDGDELDRADQGSGRWGVGPLGCRGEMCTGLRFCLPLPLPLAAGPGLGPRSRARKKRKWVRFSHFYCKARE